MNTTFDDVVRSNPTLAQMIREMKLYTEAELDKFTKDNPKKIKTSSVGAYHVDQGSRHDLVMYTVPILNPKDYEIELNFTYCKACKTVQTKYLQGLHYPTNESFIRQIIEP